MVMSIKQQRNVVTSKLTKTLGQLFVIPRNAAETADQTKDF